MAHKTSLALVAVLLAASAAQAASIGGGTEGAGEGFSDELKQGLNQIYNVAAQAASIGGGTEGAGEGFSDELKQGLNQIYNVIQELVAEIRTNGTGLAPGARQYIWAQLDVLEDMWRNASAEVHAQMPKQMLVVRDAAKVYAADVQNEEQWLTDDAKERAEALVAKLNQLAAAMEAGSTAVAGALQAAQQQQQQQEQQQQQQQEQQQEQQQPLRRPSLPRIGKVIADLYNLRPIHLYRG